MEQWQRRIRITCICVLVLAMIFRLGGSSVAKMPDADKLELASFLLYLHTGQPVHPTVPQNLVPTDAPTEPPEEAGTEAPDVTSPPTEPPETEASPAPSIAFSASDAQNLNIKYGGSYRPDIGALLEKPVELDFSGDEPRILILHTHATESYTQEPGWEYTSSGNFRTLDENFNMIRVGNLITDILNDSGIPTIHDTTVHDYPSYNSSYSRAMETIDSYLEQYPSIQMVLDVHRDAIEDSDGNQYATCSEIQGVPSAQVMLVVGTDQGGLYHPNWESNLSWGLKIQAQMDRSCPGLARALSFREERFNQQATPGSLLVEVGTAGDTLENALTAAESFAKSLAQTILGLGLTDPQ